jgi:hypothetical protein
MTAPGTSGRSWLAILVASPALVLASDAPAGRLQPAASAPAAVDGLVCVVAVAGPAVGRRMAATVTVENTSDVDIVGDVHGAFVLAPASAPANEYRAFANPLTGAPLQPHLTLLSSTPDLAGPGVPFITHVRTAPFRLTRGARRAVKLPLAASQWYHNSRVVAFASIPAGSYTLGFLIMGRAGPAAVRVESNVVTLDLR